MRSLLLAALMAAAPMATLLIPQPLAAGYDDYRYMSCGELWYERNAIFAREGYCFRTRRAIRVFGPRCYPPYGRLKRWERNRVEEIKYWERVKGCR